MSSLKDGRSVVGGRLRAAVSKPARALWDSGIVCNVVASLSLSLSSVLVKLLGDAFPVTELILARSILSLSTATIVHYLSHLKEPLFGPSTCFHLLLLRGVSGSASMLCWYGAILSLSLADSLAILFLSPALTAVMGWAVLSERVSIHTAVGCILSLAGVFIIAQPPFLFGHHDDTPWTFKRAMGITAALLGALLTAFAFIIIRRIGKRVQTVTMSMWFFSVSFTTVLPAVVLSYPGPLRLPTLLQAAAMVGIGATSFASQILMSRSLQLMAASQAANLSILQLLYGYIFGALIFHDPMTWLKSAGGALIVLGIVEVNRDKQGAKLGDGGQGDVIQEEETEQLLGDEAQLSPYQVLELTDQQDVDDDRQRAMPVEARI